MQEHPKPGVSSNLTIGFNVHVRKQLYWFRYLD